MRPLLTKTADKKPVLSPHTPNLHVFSLRVSTMSVECNIDIENMYAVPAVRDLWSESELFESRRNRVTSMLNVESEGQFVVVIIK